MTTVSEADPGLDATQVMTPQPAAKQLPGTLGKEPAEVKDHGSRLLIRYEIDNDRFAQVISSVTSRSVLLLGVASEGRRDQPEAAAKHCVIAVIPLPASVDPLQTAAAFEGDNLVLSLVKSGDSGCATPDESRGALPASL